MATREGDSPRADEHNEHQPANTPARPAPLIVRIDMSDNPSLPSIPEPGQDDEHALAQAIRNEWRTSRVRPSAKKIHRHWNRQGTV